MPDLSNAVKKTNIQTARLLTYFGATPYVFSSLALFFMADDPFLNGLFRAILIGYGAIVISFLGGIHWGISLSETHNPVESRQLVLSTFPALCSWICLLIPDPALALTLLATCHVWQVFMDIGATRRGELPQWFGHLRVQMTIVAVTCLLFGAISLL